MNRALAIGLLAALALAGCRLFGGGDGRQKPRDPVRVRSVTMVMSATANEGWPAPLELVRVRDEALVAALLRIDAEDWFGAGGEDFRHANPAAFYDAWEIVPGTDSGPYATRPRGRFGGVLFCGTRLPTPPQRLLASGHLTIHIDDEGCDVAERPRGKRWWWPW